jgi:DNA-binding protein H-NS
MATYQELIAQRQSLEKQQAELEKQIAETLQSERSNVIQQIKALMAEHGITPAELAAKPGRATKAKAGAEPTRKVAAKYRNPATGDAWSGRGLKPKWLTTAIESGSKLEDFAV